jgi:hypothetical protein
VSPKSLPALHKWLTDRSTTLDDIESTHRAVRGNGPGARAAIQQINQAYVVLLAAQFQGLCRELHTQCVRFLVAPIPNADHQLAFRINMLLNRKLDRGNPNPGNIGADFGRFTLAFWPLVDAHRTENSSRKTVLEQLNEWRNAIAHHDDFSTVLGNRTLRLFEG